MKISSKLNELKPRDLNCNVFDVYSYDGLSMQELLCQFFTKINECIKVSNETIDLASWLVNEGLRIEVVNKLMMWLEDGTLENIINDNLFNTLNTKIDNIRTQLEHFENNINTQLEHIENNIVVINSTMTINDINEKLSNGGTFLFKNGDYILNEDESLKISSNSRIMFEPNAILKYGFNKSTHYIMMDIDGCRNVIVEDAHLIGCRDSHIGTDGEWGHGINITSSKNVKIIRARIEKTWGDGIYIGYKWSETNPKYRTSTIEVLNSYIYKCSRNGISICSGDDIIIDTVLIEYIDRISPKAGIDIEPENERDDLIHMNNITINNLTTKNNGCGLGVIMYNGEKGCMGCNISINNHINYNSVAVSMYNDKYYYQFNLSNGVYYNTPFSAISSSNSSILARKVFNDIKIIGKIVDSSQGDYSLHSAIIISNDKDGEFGNFIFSNITIDTNNYQYKFKNPFSVIRTNGATSEIKNITLDNFKSTNDQGFVYLQNANIDTFKANNMYIPISTNYYLNELNRLFSNDITYTELLDWSTMNIYKNVPNGIYTIRVLKSNNLSLTVNCKDGLSFVNNASNFIIREGELRFIKKDSKITVLSTPYDGGFTGL